MINGSFVSTVNSLSPHIYLNKFWVIAQFIFSFLFFSWQCGVSKFQIKNKTNKKNRGDKLTVCKIEFENLTSCEILN